jgi:hypothetical protein
MDQSDADIFFVEIPVEASAAPDELVDFSGNLYAAEACSNDDETQIPPAQLQSAAGLRIFHLADNVLTEIDRVAHDLEREGMFAHARNNAQVALCAARNHNMVISRPNQRSPAVIKLKFTCSQIYAMYTLRAATDTRKHLTERRSGGVGINRGAGDVCEERVKDHVVFAAEDHNFAFGRPEFLTKSLRTLNRSESSANNDYSYWSH